MVLGNRWFLLPPAVMEPWTFRELAEEDRWGCGGLRASSLQTVFWFWVGLRMAVPVVVMAFLSLPYPTLP
jgi:hypothetical protein